MDTRTSVLSILRFVYVSTSSFCVPLAHGGIIPGFEVEDADAIYQQWKAKSIELIGEVTDMGAGRTFTAKDPEGHYIQVFHLYPQVREMQKQTGM
jgi:hypothetical protein